MAGAFFTDADALYPFKSRGFGGSIGMSVCGVYIRMPPFALWGFSGEIRTGVYGLRKSLLITNQVVTPCSLRGDIW